jgi:DNA-binding CsgD family transcriptional regulator/tetratricopeptide (TPR) repeat protein
MSTMAVTRQVVLVEREGALNELKDTWEGVRRTGRGAIVLVRGEAGCGKTALLRGFADSISDPVVWGACYPLSTPRPLGPFVDLAEQVGGALAEAVARDGKAHEIAAALTRSVLACGPAAVVVEDLHWADEATLDVLRLLARPIREHALLVLGSYRDDEVARGSAVQQALGDLGGSHTSRLDVPSLTVAAVKQLTRGTGLDPAALHRLTGGNAFFVTEALAAPAQDLPSTVVDAALSRLARLGLDAQQVVEAVAIVPEGCELWLVESLCGLEHLDEAVAGGVLQSGPDGVSFRHEIARRAVEGTLPPYRRLVLHRTVLAALSARPDPDSARLAHHAEAAQDSPAVLVHAPLAAQRAARIGAKREAAAHWEQALRHCPAQDQARRADLLEEHAEAVYLLDGMAESITSLEQALAIRRELGDRLAEGRLLNFLVRRLGCAGREAEAPGVLATAHEVLESLPPSGELARTFALHAYDCMEVGDVEAARAWGWRAIELAREHDAIDVEIHALNTMGMSELLHGGEPDLLLRSLALAREHDLDEAVGRALLNLSGAYADQRRVDTLAMMEEAVQDCDRRGLELWRRYVVVSRAQLHLSLGRWDDAVGGIEDLLALTAGDASLRVLAWCVAAKVRLRRGDPGADEALATVRALARGHDAVGWAGPVALVAVEQAWVKGATADQVQALSDDVLAAARAVDDDWLADELLRWRRLSGILGEPTTGRTALSEPAVEHWRSAGCGVEAALSLLDIGEQVEALALLQLIGAHGFASRVAKDLREAGVRDLPRGPRTSTRANPAQLTDRELEVLPLLAEGLANSAIAQRLVLSTKTVDKHVSAVLRKLGVSSRRDTAARALELGLTLEPVG